MNPTSSYNDMRSSRIYPGRHRNFFFLNLHRRLHMVHTDHWYRSRSSESSRIKSITVCSLARSFEVYCPFKALNHHMAPIEWRYVRSPYCAASISSSTKRKPRLEWWSAHVRLRSFSQWNLPGILTQLVNDIPFYLHNRLRNGRCSDTNSDGPPEFRIIHQHYSKSVKGDGLSSALSSNLFSQAGTAAKFIIPQQATWTFLIAFRDIFFFISWYVLRVLCTVMPAWLLQSSAFRHFATSITTL